MKFNTSKDHFLPTLTKMNGKAKLPSLLLFGGLLAMSTSTAPAGVAIWQHQVLFNLDNAIEERE